MLEIRNLSVRYGRHIALEGVSAKVAKGEICVILGANGAGKSSLLKAVAGMVKSEPGTEVLMNGKPITGMKAHRIVEQGIALVPEGRGIFGDLSVAENLQLGAFAARARSHEAETLKHIYELFPRLAERKRQIARTMSGGEQQMVAIGRALMSRPDILMLDEPSLGLSPLLSKDLFKSLAAVARTGVGILLVEQNARLSLKIAQRGYLIENGLITGENTADALMTDPAVVSAYLGGARTGDAKGEAAAEKQPARSVLRKSDIRLPAPFALPAAVEEIAQLAGKLAERAGRIQTAHVGALRRTSVVPTAFAGRYDPASGGDPWDDVERPSSPQKAPRHMLEPASAAREIARTADTLAAEASRRLGDHIASMRRPSRRADAPAPVMPRVGEWPPPAAPKSPVAPDRTEAKPEFDAGALARRAEERLRAHLASIRPAPVPSTVRPVARMDVIRDVSEALSIDEIAAQAEERARLQARPSRSADVTLLDPAAAQTVGDFAAMSARAEQRLREHLARGRIEPARATGTVAPGMVDTPSPTPSSSIEDLARLAGDRLRRHLDQNREATLTARARLFQPSDATPSQEKSPSGEPDHAPATGLNGSSPLVGHNSRGVELDDEPTDGRSRGEFDAEALARRAAEIQARHMAARRQKLTVFTVSPGTSATPGDRTH